MMADYINRAALLQDIEKLVTFTAKTGMETAEMRGADKIIDRIKIAPAVAIAPVAHGAWVMDETTYPGVSVANYKCSKCGEVNGTWLRALPTDKLPRFCRWCGAKMDGGANGGTD